MYGHSESMNRIPGFRMEGWKKGDIQKRFQEFSGHMGALSKLLSPSLIWVSGLIAVSQSFQQNSLPRGERREKLQDEVK